MNKTKVKWGQNHGTSQIYNSGPELALVSDDNEQIGTFVFCKDFFQDAILGALHGCPASIYGYTYQPGTSPPIPTKNVKVLLANSADKEILNHAENVIDFLHQFEAAVNEKTPGIKLSEVDVAEDPPAKYKTGVFLVTGDPIWLLAPPLLSGWTLMVRNGTKHKKGVHWEKTVQDIIDGNTPPAQSNDNLYLRYGLPGLKKFLADGIKECFGDDQKVNYPKEKAGGAMHHRSGIVSYGSKVAQADFPQWKYPDEATTPPSICFA